MLLRTLSVAVACLSFPLWADPVTVISKVNAGTTLTPSKTFKCEPASVQSYMDNPNPLVIFVPSSNDDFELSLNRSFKGEMMQNVDKETVERIVE
jgi:hypothetical protein